MRKQSLDLAGAGLDAGDLDMQAFATSIWDQSLYKAWASIIHDLVPNLGMIEDQLASPGVAIGADEILLFERTSFLVVSKWASREGEGNPFPDRFERMSNILKSWKHTCSKFTGTPRNAEQFRPRLQERHQLQHVRHQVHDQHVYLVCMPPGEARFNSAQMNVAAARPWFKFLDGPVVANSHSAIAGHGSAAGTPAADGGFES